MNHQAEFERLDKYTCQQLTRMLCVEFFKFKDIDGCWVDKDGVKVLSVLHFNPVKSSEVFLDISLLIKKKGWRVIFSPLHEKVLVEIGRPEKEPVYFDAGETLDDVFRARVRALLVFRGEF